MQEAVNTTMEKVLAMNGPNSQERRKYKRRSLIFYIPVIETSTQQIIGTMVDIAPKGFKLDSQYQIPLGKDYHLGLNTTPDIADIDFIGFVARSKWRQPEKPDQCQYYIGFEIIDIASHDAEIVQCIVDKYGARDLSVI
jgi:hypothetical protein